MISIVTAYFPGPVHNMEDFPGGVKWAFVQTKSILTCILEMLALLKPSRTVVLKHAYKYLSYEIMPCNNY